MVRFSKERVLTVVNILAVIEWMIALGESDAFYSGYLLIGGFAVYLLWTGKANCLKQNGIAICILSGILSFAIVLANYHILVSGLRWMIMLYAGYVAIGKTLCVLYNWFTSAAIDRTIQKNKNYIYIYIYNCIFGNRCNRHCIPYIV